MRFRSNAQRKAVMSKLNAGRNYQPVQRNSINTNSKSNVPEKLKPFTKEKWSESDVRLALRRINNGKITPSEIMGVNKSLYDGEGVELSHEQSQKGYNYLMDKWKTPRGSERANNPFGYREEETLKNFSGIKLKDFYSERGNYYYPVYRVEGK